MSEPASSARRSLRALLVASLVMATAAAAAAPPFPGRGESMPFAGCAGLGQGALSLIDVVDLALCNNPQTREAWAEVRAQAAEVGVAQGAFLPNVNASVAARHRTEERSPFGASDSDQLDTAVTLSWLIHDFGGRKADLERARALLAAVSASREAVVQTLFLSAVSGFHQVQAAGAALEASREAERAAAESLEAARTRHAVGVATPADRLQAQTAHSQAVLDRIRAEGQLRKSEGELASIMGQAPDRPVQLTVQAQSLPSERFDQAVAGLMDEARRRRPELIAAEAQLRAAEAEIAAARASGMPTVSLTAGLAHADGSDITTATGSSVGVTLSIPLYSGHVPAYRTEAARARAESQAAALEGLRNQVALEVWRAYQELQTAGQTVRTSAVLLASAEQSAKVALGRYRAGVGTLLDRLNAQSALASARQQRVQALYDWNTSRAALAQAVGALDHDLLRSLESTGGAEEQATP